MDIAKRFAKLKHDKDKIAEIEKQNIANNKKAEERAQRVADKKVRDSAIKIAARKLIPAESDTYVGLEDIF